MRLSQVFTQTIWPRRGWVAWLLWPLSWLTWAWIRLNERLYQIGWRKATRLHVPVLVVGNVWAGGTGKTPVVISLVEHLKAQGWRVGVIARAYGREDESVREVHDESLALSVGDEPLLVRRKCQVPVFVGRQRAQAAQALLQAHPQTQCLISDDGMQHRALWHDLAVCVFDARGLGNGWLLPAGPLREPWPKRLPDGVGLYALHAADHAPTPGFALKRRLATQAVNGLGETQALSHWQGQAVQALAAIAQPEVFFASLELAGLKVTLRWPRPDHDDLQDWRTTSDLPLFCTEKDAVKLWAQQPQAWAVPLVCELPATLLDSIDQDLQKLSSRHGQKTA